MIIFLTALTISIACSIDCFIMGFAYGANKVRIRPFSVFIITAFGSTFFGLSLFLGGIIGSYVPEVITTILSCVILVGVGLCKLFEKKEKETTQQNKTLSVFETLTIACALSLDCFAVGFGAGLIRSNILFYIAIILISFVTDAVFLVAGHRFGNKLAQKSKINLSWLSGILLIVLGIFHIFV